MPGPKPLQKNLFIAFDAFGTLFTPRAPIGAQYGEIARKNGICKDVSDDEIMGSFKKAFKHNAKERPNYGKEVGMDPTAWWSSLITQTFTPFLPAPSNSSTTSPSPPLLPPRLIPDLLTRFASSTGYTLYPDVLPLLTALRRSPYRRHHHPTTNNTNNNKDDQPRRKIITAVLTNSDDRVAGILRSFGLRVGHLPTTTTSSSLEEEENDIDFVLTSYDCGFEKPHRGIFDAALAVAKARFGNGGEGEEWETVYVGDEVEKDVEGAEGAGWGRAVLVDREGGGGEKEGVVEDLRELERYFAVSP